MATAAVLAITMLLLPMPRATAWADATIYLGTLSK